MARQDSVVGGRQCVEVDKRVRFDVVDSEPGNAPMRVLSDDNDKGDLASLAQGEDQRTCS